MTTHTVHQNPPFAVVSDTDHAAWILIGTAIGIPIIMVFGGIRFAVRRAVNFGLDDGLIAASTAFAIVQASLVFGACSHGFGRTTEQLGSDSLVSLQQLYYGSNILFLIALALSKASVAALLLRLCADEKQKRQFLGALGFIVVWMIASIFAISLQCNLSRPWIFFDEDCGGVLLRWQAIGGLDIAWEVFLIAMTAALVWNLQAPFGTKVQVVGAFSFRLPILAAIAARLAVFPESRLTEDPSLELAEFVVWTQAELYWSIIAATIPSMRPFLRGLSTTETTVFENSTDPATRAEYELSKDRSKNRFSRFTKSFTKSSAKRSQISQSQTAIELDPIPTRTVAQASRGRNSQLGRHLSPKPDMDRVSVSSGSNESQHMIIRKDVTWTIDRD